ncbi:MAG: IS30 family transposase [Christensenellales bacterium]
MSHYKYIRKRQAGKHLTYIDRQKLEVIVKGDEMVNKRKRRSLRNIAHILQSSLSTISRELKRGKVGPLLRSDLTTYFSYSADVSQQKYVNNNTGKGRGIKLGHDYAFAAYVSQQILEHKQSPDAIIMRLKRDGNPFETDICTRTLYNYIEKGYIPGVEISDLPRRGQTPKRRYRVLRQSNKGGGGKSIEERPEAANLRTEDGHWEMDCMMPGKREGTSCLLVMTERTSRESIIRKLRAARAEEVIKALNQLERDMGAAVFRKRFKTITMDNGAEFSGWRDLEQSCLSKKKRTSIYYCHPYSAWERGSVENVIGHIRRFIPKGSNIGKIPRQHILEIESWLNNLPRRLLGGKSTKIASGQPEAA